MGPAVVDAIAFIGLILLAVLVYATSSNMVAVYYTMAAYVAIGAVANIVYGYTINRVVDGYACSAGIAAFAVAFWFAGWMEADPAPRARRAPSSK